MTDDVRGIDKLTARRIWGGTEWMDMNIMILVMKESNLHLLCRKFQLKIPVSHSFTGSYANNVLYLLRSNFFIVFVFIRRHSDNLRGMF